MTVQPYLDGRERLFCFCGCGTDITDRRLGTMWASESCRKAFLRGRAPANASKGRPKRRRTPSERGVQLSYRKSVIALADEYHLHGSTWAHALGLAESVLRPVVPERQRALLEQREAA